ncbi:hypothetical protein D9615_007907 [Tricholomella constricta]|uniref:Uncharacterized protein n=1 Tax=Tricholomella constricta TaxID=117010 RepID=A0A8H5M111_9AGAR|nr:hypothetical protein D9615_007907 [Tricholomella constricta]
MFSSFVSFLPSLHLNGSSSSSNLAQAPTPGAFDPTDNPEEEKEAYKEQQQQQPVEDDTSAKKAKPKGVNETFIIVRPPPAKSNHPLNLQVQLVPPATRNPRQSLDESDGGATTNTSVSLTRTTSNRSDTSSYGSTASFTSTNSSASSRRTIIPLYNLQAHNVLTNTIVDAGTDAKIAKFQKRGIEVIDLAVFEPVEVWSERPGANPTIRNSRPVTPDPSAHTTTTAESSVVSLPVGSNLNPNATSQIPTSAVPTAQPAPGPPSKRNLFGKMFKKKDSTSSLVSPPVSPALTPRFSPKAPAKTLSPDPAATPTPRSSRAHTRNLSAALPVTLSGNLRGRSSSPNPNAVGLGLLQVPSLDDPAFTHNGSATNLGTPTNPTSNMGEDQKILRPPVLGIQPTLSFSYAAGGAVPDPVPLGSLAKGGRALMYVWFVRRWYKRRGDDAEGGGLLGMVNPRGSGFSVSGNSNAAGEGVEVRFEWKRSSAKARARRGRDRESKEGKDGRRGQEGQVREREREAEGPTKGNKDPKEKEKEKPVHRLSIISISTNLSASEDGHRERSGTPTDRDRDRDRGDDDGEESDPEDSETPWVCTLKIRRTGPGTTGSTFTTRSRQATSHGGGPSEGANGNGNLKGGGDEELGVLPLPQPQPQVLRVKVGTLSPTPHHPKVVAMLKVPFPLPDVEVERMGVVKRPVGAVLVTGLFCGRLPNTRQPPTQWAGLTLTAEEIKDVTITQHTQRHVADIMSNEMFVAGYYMDFATTHAAMERLGIDDRGVEDYRLELPLRNWLAENNKLDVLPGAIPYPPGTYSSTGILFMTQFIERYCNRNRDPLPDVYERPRDRAVKEWLVTEAGVPESNLVWVAMWDLTSLTLSGFIPTRNDFKGPRTYRKMTSEEVKARAEYLSNGGTIVQLSAFLKMYDEKKEKEKEKEEAQIHVADIMSREIFVAGYYTDFATTHAAMDRLGIDKRGVEDFRLDWPLRNWLAENDRLNVLPSVIPYPPGEYDGTGVLFMTQFIEGFCNRNKDPLPDVHERRKDRAVKEWLVTEAGMPEANLVWVAMWDLAALTLNGFVPMRNKVRGHLNYRELTHEEVRARAEYLINGGTVKKMSEFLKMYDEKKKEEKEKEEAQLQAQEKEEAQLQAQKDTIG